MRLPDVLLDTLSQSPGSRRSLLGGLALFAAVSGSDDTASGRKRNKKRCKRRKQCGKGCCGADSCFAETVNADNGEPLAFACCPADNLCRSTNPNFKDQCCYPDETCRPSLVDDPAIFTICCRPCGGNCCPNLDDECIDGECKSANTARLPRTRRPG